MRQKILHIATCGSFLLCVVAVAAWGRSYWRHDSWVKNSSGVQRVFNSKTGHVDFSRVRCEDADGKSMIDDRQGEWESRPSSGRSSIPQGITPWQRLLG